MSIPTKLPASLVPEAWNSKEAWRVFGIMSEFVSATERLNQIHPAVSIFGSARTKPDQPYYKLTEEISRLLSDAGFSVISGGGPGIMEAANKGAYYGKSPSVGLNIQLPHEQVGNAYQNILACKFPRRQIVSPHFRVIFGGFGCARKRLLPTSNHALHHVGWDVECRWTLGRVKHSQPATSACTNVEKPPAKLYARRRLINKPGNRCDRFTDSYCNF